MLLLIDNYDSFTYNLVQAFQILGSDPLVLRNDQEELLNLVSHPSLQGVVLSPGPGGPLDSGLCLPFLEGLPENVPVLGVCLGHQILAYFSGYKIIRAERIMHGKISEISHNKKGIFYGLDSPFLATRYHSLIMEETNALAQTPVDITARSETDEPMGLKLSGRPWWGVQFHPESILTQQGPKLLENFIKTLSGYQNQKTDQQKLQTVYQ